MNKKINPRLMTRKELDKIWDLDYDEYFEGQHQRTLEAQDKKSCDARDKEWIEWLEDRISPASGMIAIDAFGDDWQAFKSRIKEQEDETGL